jgi:hypothetical protein
MTPLRVNKWWVEFAAAKTIEEQREIIERELERFSNGHTSKSRHTIIGREDD